MRSLLSQDGGTDCQNVTAIYSFNRSFVKLLKFKVSVEQHRQTQSIQANKERDNSKKYTVEKRTRKVKRQTVRILAQETAHMKTTHFWEFVFQVILS